MLSIIIPTHHRTDLLRACLQAATTHAPRGTEIIVVDDASPDRGASVTAARFGVACLRSNRQRGFAVAANAGIRASRGDIVEMLNDDTEVQPGWADAALPWFDDAKVGAVAPLVLVWPDGKIIDSAGDRYYVGGVASKRGHGRILPSPPVLRGRGAGGEGAVLPPSPPVLRGRGAGGEGAVLPPSPPVLRGRGAGGEGAVLPPSPPVLRGRGAGGEGVDFLEPCRVFGTSAAAGFYRRSALDRVGLFPEDFHSYFEDVDLAFRLNRAGYQAMYEPASRVLHHVSASFGRAGRRLIEQQSCNEERVYWRNLPPLSWHAFLKHAAVLLGKAWLRLNEGTIMPWLFGRLRALGQWREIMRHERTGDNDVMAVVEQFLSW